MYFSLITLAAANFVVVLVKAQAEAENNEKINLDVTSKEEEPAENENKENQYTELNDFYTFVALIDIVFKDRSKRTCTGAIIDDNVVITAAHCFTGKDRFVTSKPELTASFVVIGTKAMFETGYEQYLPIEKVITHPMFEGWTADLALVYTFAGMTSDKPGLIIPLAGDMSAHVDSNVTVYSWGEPDDNEADSYEPPPKKKKRKTTAHSSSCSEDEDDEHKHKKTKSSFQRFRHSSGGESSNEANTQSTKIDYYGNRYRHSPGFGENIARKAQSSIERLGKKRTAMFYGNRMWSTHSTSTTTASSFPAENKSYGKTLPVHQRAEDDETDQKYETKNNNENKNYNEKQSKKSTKGHDKKKVMTNKNIPDDYYDLVGDGNGATKQKSRYLAGSATANKTLNSSIKPYRFGESINFSDSFEKELVKKHYTSKSTRNIHKKHSTIKKNTTNGRHNIYPEQYNIDSEHYTRQAPISKKNNKKKKIKPEVSKSAVDKTYKQIFSFRSQGWRRNLDTQQNQLYVGSFGYVNIQSCRALVEKAMPAKYEISKGNDAICYTSTKRCIGENDSGAPAVRQGILIAITVGGAQCEGDNVAVGMKMNCYCSWISDNLPIGSPKFNCCKNCCDLKHKENQDDQSQEKHNKNKSKRKHRT